MTGRQHDNTPLIHPSPLLSLSLTNPTDSVVLPMADITTKSHIDLLTTSMPLFSPTCLSSVLESSETAVHSIFF